MSAKTKASTATQERIIGAKAGVDALRKLVQSAGNSDIGPTAADYYGWKIQDAQVLVANIKFLGPLTPAQEGAIAAIGEYIHDSITSGEPNLEDGWRSMAAMDDATRQKMFKSLQDDMETDAKRWAERQARGNVINFPERQSRNEARP